MKRKTKHSSKRKPSKRASRSPKGGGKLVQNSSIQRRKRVTRASVRKWPVESVDHPVSVESIPSKRADSWVSFYFKANLDSYVIVTGMHDFAFPGDRRGTLTPCVIRFDRKVPFFIPVTEQTDLSQYCYPISLFDCEIRLPNELMDGRVTVTKSRSEDRSTRLPPNMRVMNGKFWYPKSDQTANWKSLEFYILNNKIWTHLTAFDFSLPESQTDQNNIEIAQIIVHVDQQSLQNSIATSQIHGRSENNEMNRSFKGIISKNVDVEFRFASPSPPLPSGVDSLRQISSDPSKGLDGACSQGNTPFNHEYRA